MAFWSRWGRKQPQTPGSGGAFWSRWGRKRPQTPGSGGALSRRSFLIAGGVAGGGLLVGFALWQRRRGRGAEPRPDAYIRIGGDGSIVLTVDECEMGQGVCTAL